MIKKFNNLVFLVSPYRNFNYTSYNICNDQTIHCKNGTQDILNIGKINKILKLILFLPEKVDFRKKIIFLLLCFLA